MFRRKTKFKLSLGKISLENLTVEFENDQASDPELLDNLRASLRGVIEAPARLLSLGTNEEAETFTRPALNGSPSESANPSPKSRRRRKVSPAGQPKTAQGSGSDSGAPVPEEATSSVRADSVKGLILQLHREDYFRQERSSSDVGQELSNRWGRKVKTNHIATILQQLTGNALARRQSEDRKMLYRSAAHAV